MIFETLTVPKLWYFEKSKYSIIATFDTLLPCARHTLYAYRQILLNLPEFIRYHFMYKESEARKVE